MNELTRTRKLVQDLSSGLNGSVVIKHTDSHTQGVPDISVTWAGITSWWEAKLIKKNKIIGREVQNEMMRRMERAGLAYYVIYNDKGEVYITSPSNVADGLILAPESVAVGKCNEAVVGFIRQLHLRKNRNAL